MSIFLSHSCDDHNHRAYRDICSRLDVEKVPRWKEKDGLRTGDFLTEKLREAIIGCDICLFLATRNSIKSDWCAAELGAFWYAGKKVLVYNPDEVEIPVQFEGIVHRKDIDIIVRDTVLEWNKAQEVPSFGRPLWRPFEGAPTMIVVPRIRLPDSWSLNSEEVRLILGTLSFLGAGVQGTNVRFHHGEYEKKNLVVLGALHLDRSGWKNKNKLNDRFLHDELLEDLLDRLKSQGSNLRLFRNMERGTKNYASSGIQLDEKVWETEEVGGRVEKDVGMVVRMKHPYNPELKAIWAFGFSAPGTRYALEKDTQKILSAQIRKYSLDDFIAPFEVKIKYDRDEYGIKSRAKMKGFEFDLPFRQLQ